MVTITTEVVSIARELPLLYAVGIDVGSKQCSMCTLRTDRSVVIKPLDFAYSLSGLAWLDQQLERLGCPKAQILIGLEATSNLWENIYHFLLKQGYKIQLLHPAQTYQFAKKRGMRAKTDRLDAHMLARFLLSDEVRPAYVPNELITAYRELIRLHTNLADEATRYKNEIHALVAVLFPEYIQVFIDPTAPTALALLRQYPSAKAIEEAGEEALYTRLHELAPRRYGRKTAQQLVALARHSLASGLARQARSLSLQIICEQLSQTVAKTAQIEEELAHLMKRDKPVEKLSEVKEFGHKLVAVLRGELGEVERFKRSDQVVAYAGMDLIIRQSGQWKGQAKLSKRGSGLLRRVLYMAVLSSLRLVGSPFRAYYEALVARGLKGRKAVMAVMRKMLLVAYRLLKHPNEEYDPKKVWAVVPQAVTQTNSASSTAQKLAVVGA